MSFLETKTLNPHLLLHALTLPPLNQQESTPLKRLNLLARTRRFNDIKQASEKVKQFTFPTLIKKLQVAEQQSLKSKQQLGVDNILETLKKLIEMSEAEDPDFEAIDLAHEKAFKLAQILFEEGDYKKSLDILIALEKQDLKEQLWLKCTWARVYNEIIIGQDTIKTLESLKRKIDDIQNEELAFYSKQKKDHSQLVKKFYAQKEQFLILSCFSLWRQGRATEEDLERFVDFATTEKSYFSAVQLVFPQILRYIIVAIALNKTLQNNRSFDLFKLVEAINRKIVTLADPFTEFITLLHIEFDFESAAAKIEQCRAAIKSDIFLSFLQDRIIEGLQFLYFKLACKVYQSIPLKEVATFIQMGEDDAQLWLLGYIRSGDIDAKIDSIAQSVISSRGRHNAAQKYTETLPSLSTFLNSLSRAIASQ